MIPAVVVSLVLVTSTIAIPLTTQEYPITGVQETPQIQSGTPLTIVPQQIEKTGVQSSEIYTPTGHGTQAGFNQVEKSSVQSTQYTGLNTAQHQQAEKSGLQTPSDVHTSQEYSSYNQQNTAVPKVENEPVNAEQVQSFYTQSSVLLPVQPLSVVPVNPTGQILRPVVVPAEAIADGRVIITSIGSIQQRNFHQEAFVTPEKQVLQQQVTQPNTYAVQTQGVEPHQQVYYVQPVEKQTPHQQEIQPTSQDYTPVQFYPNQEQLNREQQVPTANVVKQTVEPAQNYYQAPVDHSFSQKVQPESTEKQVTYQVASSQVPVQQVEFNSQQQQVYNVQQASEKHVPYQQNDYAHNQAYSGKPVVVDNVEKHGQYQQSTEFQTQSVEPSYQQQQQVYNSQQAVEKQAQYQQVDGYTPVQNQQVEQQVVQKAEKHGQYQPGYSQPQQQVENVQQTVEKQATYQQPDQASNYVPVQTHPEQSVYQQQVYSVQPQQVESQVPYNQASQNAENVPEKILKTSEVEPNQQVISVQPQQVANYAGEPVYNFGDKLPQVQSHVPVHTLSAVPQTQENSVQPSVSSIQE